MIYLLYELSVVLHMEVASTVLLCNHISFYMRCNTVYGLTGLLCRDYREILF